MASKSRVRSRRRSYFPPSIVARLCPESGEPSYETIALKMLVERSGKDLLHASEVAKELSINVGRAYYILSRLEKLGLAKSYRDPDNGRVGFTVNLDRRWKKELAYAIMTGLRTRSLGELCRRVVENMNMLQYRKSDVSKEVGRAKEEVAEEKESHTADRREPPPPPPPIDETKESIVMTTIGVTHIDERHAKKLFFRAISPR